MREYHLHKGDYSKLQLDIHEAGPYCEDNRAHCFKPHRHSFLQLIWFHTPGQHYVDFRAHEHPANAIFFLSPTQIHHFCEESENEGVLFHFNDIFLNRQDKDTANQIQYRLFSGIGAPYVVLPEKLKPNFEYLTGRLQAEAAARGFKYKLQVYNYFQVLLLEVERLKQQEEVQLPLDGHFDLALRFKQLVAAQRMAFQPVAFFCSELGVSDKTLNAVSKKFFKLSPSQVIHQHRVLEAKRLLSHTELAVSEVAYRLGFEQATYFTKYFKKHTGQTPKQFQKAFR